MKIAFFVTEFPSLSQTFVLRHITGLIKRGHQVDIITGKYGDRSLILPVLPGHDWTRAIWVLRATDNKPAILRQLAGFLAKALFSQNCRRALAAFMRAAWTGSIGCAIDIGLSFGQRATQNYDAVIAHFGPAGVRAMFLQQAGLFTGPIATVFHGYDMSARKIVAANRAGYKLLFKRTARLLPISELWGRRLAEWGAPPAKIEILRMGVDIADFPAPTLTRPLSSPLRILSVARLVEKKGISYAIDAVAKSSFPMTYDIIGNGPIEGELRIHAEKSANKISLLGKKPHAEVLKLLMNYDVFLLPSVTAADGDMEGIPVALMEAMALGLVTVATRHSGNPELIENGVSGFLVPERDAGAITRVLESLVNGRHDLPALRCAAYATVENYFDNAKLDAQLEGICAVMSDGGND